MGIYDPYASLCLHFWKLSNLDMDKRRENVNNACCTNKGFNVTSLFEMHPNIASGRLYLANE